MKLHSEKYNDTFLFIMNHRHPQAIGKQKIDHKPMICHANDNTMVEQIAAFRVKLDLLVFQNGLFCGSLQHEHIKLTTILL